jgi:DNA-binding XRE family transcriptional regulator
MKTTIIEARKQMGLTQIELAQRAGISQPTVCRCEKGIPPGRKTAVAIKNALNKKIKLSDILGEEE